MKPEIAIRIFKKQYPDTKVCGYWQNGKEIILNTEVKDISILDQPAQYVIGQLGEIIPTNPARHNLTSENYVKIDA